MTEETINAIVETLCLPDFENSIGWMYRDFSAKGIVTCAVGSALFSQADALKLPWHEPDGTLSGAAQVAADYQAVLAAPLGHTTGFYEPLTKCRLMPDDMKSLCRADVLKEWGKMLRHFPAADSFPMPAIRALSDLNINLGGDWPVVLKDSKPEWLHLAAAVLAQDWATSAVQSHRAPPISASRNKYVHDQFVACL